MFWSRSVEPPDPATLKPCRVLLASEGRPISAEAIAFAADMARGSGTQVRVLSIARIWGTSLGIPAPGLLPNKQEWQDQRDLVADGVRALKRRGVDADGHVLGARNPTIYILREAERLAGRPEGSTGLIAVSKTWPAAALADIFIRLLRWPRP